MAAHSEIVVVGSLNTDLVSTVDRFPDPGETLVGSDFQIYCGGKGANQAYAVGRLGGNVAMVGQVGNDDFGQAQIENLDAVGVETKHVERDPELPTGTAMICVDSSGENRIIIVPGANGSFSSDRLGGSREVLLEAKVILMQLEISLETVADAIQLGKEGGAKIILDPAPARSIPEDWFPSIDYLTPNLIELGALTDDRLSNESPLEEIVSSARKLCHRGVHCVLAKLGARGAVMVTAETHTHWSARAVKAVDSTAAGDCFNAAFAVELAAGRSEEEAVRFAVNASSLSVTRRGAQPAMPSRADMEGIDASWKERLCQG